jgi:hypothetical protein
VYSSVSHARCGSSECIVQYFPLLMNDFLTEAVAVRRSVSYIVRSKRAGSDSLLAGVQQAVWSVNPNLPLARVRTLQEIYDQSLARSRRAHASWACAWPWAPAHIHSAAAGPIAWFGFAGHRRGYRCRGGTRIDTAAREPALSSQPPRSIGLRVGICGDDYRRIGGLLLTRLARNAN